MSNSAEAGWWSGLTVNVIAPTDNCSILFECDRVIGARRYECDSGQPRRNAALAVGVVAPAPNRTVA